jgi:hypothetical protein
MNCANHSNQAAVAFCRTCGKPLCNQCTRDVRGVIYCESCLAARMEAPAPPGFTPTAGFKPVAGYTPVQTAYTPVGAAAPSPHVGSGPNPAVAGILAGFFPIGVGAVYCSQYAKGLAYLAIMSMLGYGTDHAGSLSGLFVAAFLFFWVFQIMDAVRSARAIQAGQTPPDPIGIASAFGTDKVDTSKIPIGAVILIGLGVLFLLHTMGFWEFGIARFWPMIIIAVGAWMLYRNWEHHGRVCGCARCRTRGLMGPGMVLLTGFLLLLSTLDIAGLDRTWPAWILAVGVIQLLRSTASTEGHIGRMPPMPPSAPPPPPYSQPGPPPSGSSDFGSGSSQSGSSQSGSPQSGSSQLESSQFGQPQPPASGEVTNG